MGQIWDMSHGTNLCHVAFLSHVTWDKLASFKVSPFRPNVSTLQKKGFSMDFSVMDNFNTLRVVLTMGFQDFGVTLR